MLKKTSATMATGFIAFCLCLALLPETALSNPLQAPLPSKSKRRKKAAQPAKKPVESTKPTEPSEPPKQKDKSDSSFNKYQCVTWEVTVRTNPLFPDADTVDWDVTGNVVDSGDGQCEVKIKNQRKTTFLLTSRPPYRDGENVIIDCRKLKKCESGN